MTIYIASLYYSVCFSLELLFWTRWLTSCCSWANCWSQGVWVSQPWHTDRPTLRLIEPGGFNRAHTDRTWLLPSYTYIINTKMIDDVTLFAILALFACWCCEYAFVGVLAFFFFTRQIPVIQEEVPSLNYYWVPLLVSASNTLSCPR